MAADRAAERERSRIAWELHDVLAHTLGAMVMQAAASGELVTNGPHKARRALERIADMGREAVADTGRLLRLIRDPTDELGLGVDVSQPRMPALAEPASTNPRLTYRDGLLPTAFGTAATVEVVVAGFPVVGVWFGAVWLTAAVLCFSRCWPLAMPPVAALVGVAALVASGSNDLPGGVDAGGGDRVLRPGVWHGRGSSSAWQTLCSHSQCSWRVTELPVTAGQTRWSWVRSSSWAPGLGVRRCARPSIALVGLRPRRSLREPSSNVRPTRERKPSVNESHGSSTTCWQNRSVS